MSKINPVVKKSMEKFENNVQLAGGTGALAAKQNELALLRRCVLANLLWEDNAYVDGETTASQIAELIPMCYAKDVAMVM